MSDKKKLQLGMNPSTASGRLVKDILWKLIVQTSQNICCKCHEPMARDTFSIEHIVPWLDSNDPQKLFFDLNNIGFSHLRCNVSDTRNPNKKFDSSLEREKARQVIRRGTRPYDPNKRRLQYINNGT